LADPSNTALAPAHAEVVPTLDNDTGEQIIPVPVQGPPFEHTSAPDPAANQVSERGLEAPERPPDVAAERPKPRHKLSFGLVVYRTLDTALWLVNRPFNWLSPNARRLVGAIAIVTLLTALIAPYVLPLICPPH
jgi:hypothetical protein